ncbi:SAS complex subunit [Conoideocrella luteorostrata]|uniref:histone acetyltransferase n=1 Tax=Conoideocrella luteorostrata TaxID=1105319 RepID=A0AAJ0FSN6_9HYPO|nr:SAS complex subunit [Conoideocrella luteorostrata]
MHQCQGYDEPFLFVNQALPGTQELRSKKSASQHKDYWNQQLGAITPRDKDALTHPGPRISLVGFKDNIVISHFVTNLRIGFEQNPASMSDAPTMRAAMESFGNNTSAYVSGLSVAEVYFDQIHKVDQLHTHAVTLYGQSMSWLRSDLQQMNRNFSRPKAFLSLWTAYFLSLFELISAASPGGMWLQHAQGVASLIQMLGPEAFQSSSANALYEVKRPFLGIAHIVLKKRCFLESENWKTVPWAPQPDSKLPGSLLMDVFVDIPGIIEVAHRLQGDAEKMKVGTINGAEILAARTMLQDKTLAAIHRLSEARWKWEDMYPRVCWKTRINLATTLCLDEEGKPLFDTCLNFVGMKRTFEILFYNVSRLLLFHLSDLAGLRDDDTANMDHAWQRHGPFLNPLLLPGLGTRESHALEICRIVDYLMNGEQNYHGAYILLFPLRVARTKLESSPKLHNWIGRILKQFAEEKGLKIGEYLNDVTQSGDATTAITTRTKTTTTTATATTSSLRSAASTLHALRLLTLRRQPHHFLAIAFLSRLGATRIRHFILRSSVLDAAPSSTSRRISTSGAPYDTSSYHSRLRKHSGSSSRMPLVLHSSSSHPGRPPHPTLGQTALFFSRSTQAMPQKRKRPDEPAQAVFQSLTRRATRQTPVLPPLPPTSAGKVAQAPAAGGPTGGPGPGPGSGSGSGSAALEGQQTQPNQKPKILQSTTGPTTPLPPISNPTAAASQTPVPIPSPPGLTARNLERPRTAVPPPQVPPLPAETPVPVPVITPVSPPSIPRQSTAAISGTGPPARQSMSGVSVKENIRPSDLVAPEITYHVPQPALPGRVPSSLLRPHGPSTLPPRLDRRPAPPVVTPVLPPKPPTLAVNDRGPPRADRNIDKVVLGDLCFRTWYPSYYGKEVLGDTSGNARSGGGGGSKDGGQDTSNKASKRDREVQPMLDRLYVCPCCFKYAKELVTWRGHVKICERQAFIPGTKVYMHPRGRRRVSVAHDGKGPGPKRRRRDSGVRHREEIVQDEGEWSIWEVDGEKHGLFCQNLSLFAKLFLDNKSVFFDVTGFNYFLLVYTPPAKPAVSGTEPVQSRPSQVTGFFSKEKMSWDNNNLACILVFPPWQRKGLGALLMGASYEISRREGILGGPEKPISDLGKKGYKRFWCGEIARWLLSLENTAQQPQSQLQPQQGGTGPTQELIVDVNDCSQGTWIAVEDCLSVLRDMGIVVDAGMGYGKPEKKEEPEDNEGAGAESQGPEENDATGQKQDASSKPAEEKQLSGPAPVKIVPRVRVDKDAVRLYVARHRISLERTCDPDGFVEGYAVKVDRGEETDGAKQAVEAA